MPQIKGWVSLFVVLSSFFVYSTIQAQSKESKDADLKEVRSYALTDKKFELFSNAVKSAAKVIQQNPQIVKSDSDDADDQSIKGIVAMVDKSPDLKKAIESAGMTTRDFVLFEMAIINGASGSLLTKAGQKLPPEISPDQVEFYQKNETKLKALTEYMDSVQKIVDKKTGEDDDDSDSDQ